MHSKAIHGLDIHRNFGLVMCTTLLAGFEWVVIVKKISESANISSLKSYLWSIQLAFIAKLMFFGLK